MVSIISRPSYVSLEQPSEKMKGIWTPILILLALSACVCISTVSLHLNQRFTLLDEDSPAALDTGDFQEGSQTRYALPDDVDKVFNSVQDNIGSLEARVSNLKKNTARGQKVNIVLARNLGLQGPQGPVGPVGAKGVQGLRRSGPQSIKACSQGSFFNGASCSLCTTGACPVGMYRSACTGTDDSRCIM
jgi:hypothetical protein